MANRRSSQGGRKGPLTAVLAAVLVVATAVAVFGGCGGKDLPAQSGSGPAPQGSSGMAPPAGGGSSQAQTADAPQGEYRAVWLTYLEYQGMDMSSEASFRTAVATAFDQIAALGANTVVAHVRPFSDALYRSALFPWSHLLTGAQGADPGYDPLAVMVEEAHGRGLRLEALVNPYRIRGAGGAPETLAEGNPAALYAADPEKSDWVLQQDGGTYYNPAVPEVRQLIVDGVREICQNYQVDGVQFDDYFYPEGADDSFDQAAYERLAGGADRGDWRRENVNALVRDAYAAVKAVNPSLTFGISPQGNNDNNYNIQYSDVALWMAESGYVDYVMPQIYWGFDYRTGSGRDDFAFENCLAGWLALPRAQGVKLYVGLGAYRIGAGDGGSNDQAEWSSGSNLARQVRALRQAGADGYGLYSYRWLFQNDQPTVAAEVEALTGANG